MTQAILSPVSFHGNTLFVTDHSGEPFAPMKPIVEGMGLDWRTQHRKLTENRERWGVVILTIPTVGERQQAVCMPLRKLPAFFASISVNKVRADLRATIILFQNECDDALWKYWSEKKQRVQIEAKPAQPTLDTTTRLSVRTDPERKELTAMVNAWVNSSPIGYAAARSVINAHFGVTSVDSLTVAQVKDAIEFVRAKIAEQPKALPESNVVLDADTAAYLAAKYPKCADAFMKSVTTTDEDELERLFLSMCRLVKEFRVLDQDMHAILERAARRQMRRFDARRTFAVANLHAAEAMGNSLAHMLDAMKHHAQAVLTAERM